LGIFIGGALGGWLLGKLGIAGVFAFCTLISALWFLIASRTRLPRRLSNHMIKVGQLSSTEAGTLAGKLGGLAGVAEAVVVSEDGIAYLKIDRDRLDWDALRALLPARE
ncbi:MAG: MFS transporter, partial [Gammaproteobacteria bacterium]